MPFVLIKNNLKLMLRSKFILFMMIIFPVTTIALLSNAFKDMMNTSYHIDRFKVGYRISEDSNYKGMLKELQKKCRDKDIILQEYPQGDITSLLQNKTVAVFVNIRDDNSYVIYQSNDKNTEAAITESIFSGFFYQVSQTAAAQSYGAKQETVNIPVKGGGKVTHEALDTEPVPSSTDYYGIVYIVYFTWCGLCSLLAVASSERKGAVSRRMLISHMPKLHYYLGKFIPCTLAVIIEIAAAWVLSVLLFHIHWGNIGLSALILFLTALCASAFGVLLFQSFSNPAISIVSAFVIIWVAGFFGGCFATYMYNIVPVTLAQLSPIYYINRTLVEFSTKGYSNYTGRCIAYLIGLLIAFGLSGILLMNRKLEEQ